MSPETKALYEFGRFRCDPQEHLLLCEGKPVSLSPKSFEVLVALIQSNGRLLTKDEVMQQVWPDSFVEESNLTVNISALRRALGETPGGQQYIETVPKLGYRFVVPVTACRDDSKRVPPPVAAPSLDAEQALPGVAPASKLQFRFRRWWLAPAGLLGVVILVSAALVFRAPAKL